MSELLGDNLHIITDDNIKYYVDIPPHVNKLLPNNVANWSDYLRVLLLEVYGGIWIDATVLIGNNFMKKVGDVLENDTFVMAGYKLENNIKAYTSWFMATNTPGSYISSMIRSAISLWLKSHEGFNSYLFIYYLIDSLEMLDPKFSSILNKSYMVSSADSYRLHHKLYDNRLCADDISFELEKNIVNKLNYKINPDLVSRHSGISKIIRYPLA